MIIHLPILSHICSRKFSCILYRHALIGDWIIQKMDANLTPWSDSGRWGQRQPSHHQAWNNVKRHPHRRGEHFKLDDARIWMRLHFWAARECGLAEHEPFWNWYILFIRHFVNVYDGRAPPYARADAEWSSSVSNIQTYLDNNRRMSDVINARTGY